MSKTLFFVVYAVIAAMILRPVDTWISNRTFVQNLQAKYPSGTPAYAVAVGTLAAVIFVALSGAALALRLVGEGTGVKPPTA